MTSKNALDEALIRCGKEPIHIPGAIQSFGMLFALEDSTLKVRYCSNNTQDVFGIAPVDLLNRSIRDFIPTSRLESSICESDFLAKDPVRIVTGEDGHVLSWEAFLHRHRGQLILELESVSKDSFSIDSLNRSLHAALSEVDATCSLSELCQRGCERIREITGLDGVMVYRFHDDEHGEVIAEAKGKGFPKYLGLHFPASDIPRQARELFLNNWVRMIPDRNYQPVPLLSNPSNGIDTSGSWTFIVEKRLTCTFGIPQEHGRFSFPYDFVDPGWKALGINRWASIPRSEAYSL
jgi:light-regulated signal transduction histidine kinase (bacteriophytochrome)